MSGSGFSTTSGSVGSVTSESTNSPVTVWEKIDSGRRRELSVWLFRNFEVGRILPRATPEISGTRHSTSVICRSRSHVSSCDMSVNSFPPTRSHSAGTGRQLHPRTIAKPRMLLLKAGVKAGAGGSAVVPVGGGARRIVEGEELVLEGDILADVVQGHHGVDALGIQHLPLAELEGILGEDQGQLAIVPAVGGDDGNRESPGNPGRPRSPPGHRRISPCRGPGRRSASAPGDSGRPGGFSLS